MAVARAYFWRIAMIIYLKGIIQRLIFDTLEGSLFEFFNTYREKKLMAGFTCLPAFRKNGVLFTNYEARNGSVFGLKKQRFVLV